MLARILRERLRPLSVPLTWVVVLQLASSLANLYLPSLNADIIDEGVARGDTGYVVRTGGWMLAVSLLQVGAALGTVWFASRTSMGVGRDLRAAVFSRVGDFSAREVADFGAPTLISRTTNDVQQVQMLVLMGCTMFVAAPISMIGGVVMALREDAGLSWLLAVAVPVLALSIGLVVSRMVPLFRRMQTGIDEINRVMREQIAGIRVVRAFVRESRESTRFGVANDDLTGTTLAVGRLQALMFPIVMAVLNFSTVAVLWFGASRVESGQLQVGSLIAFMSYLLQILFAVMMGTFVMMMIPRASVSAERISEVLETQPSVVLPAQPVTTVDAHAELEFVGVSFRYPGADSAVLEDISLRTAPGRTTAVIGSTGSGKTTLLSLVPRLFDATDGSVRVDGVDVRDLHPEVLWRRIGLVPQKAYLFTGTVASNLRFGDSTADDEQLWEALEVAQAGDFVRALPQGLESPVAQGGTNFSGGQRQRLAIARALVRRPEIYLFDDSFSALDLATDARLRAALAPETREASVVIVAQRVSTIMDADEILVLEDGRVVGRGRHDDLVQTCSTYAEIVESQAAADDGATERRLGKELFTAGDGSKGVRT